MKMNSDLWNECKSSFLTKRKSLEDKLTPEEKEELQHLRDIRQGYTDQIIELERKHKEVQKKIDELIFNSNTIKVKEGDYIIFPKKDYETLGGPITKVTRNNDGISIRLEKSITSTYSSSTELINEDNLYINIDDLDLLEIISKETFLEKAINTIYVSLQPSEVYVEQ